MKKFIITSFLLLFLVLVPQSAAAQTTAELQALIASLQAQVAALTAQLEALQNGGGQNYYVQATSTSSTLQFSLNDDYGNGGLLAVHNINIRAVGKDIYVPNFSPFRHSLFLNGESNYRSNANNSWIITVEGSARTVKCPKVGGECYRIPAGTAKNFRIAYQWDTRQLFGGVYYHQVFDILYLNSGSSQYQNVPVYGAVTNKVVVVGEKSPYISSVTSSVKAGGVVTITGSRLCKDVTVLLSGSYEYVGPTTCNSGYSLDTDSMTFSLDDETPAGSYRLELSSGTHGKSNVKFLEVVGSTSIQSSITVISPNGGENYPSSSGDSSFVVSWTTTGNLPSVYQAELQLIASSTGEVVSSRFINAIPGTFATGGLEFTNIYAQYDRYLVRVCLPDNVCDLSDSYFTITSSTPDEPAPEPTVAFMTVLNPNGGENWTIGESRNIRWTTNTVPEEKIRIRLVSLAEEGSSDEGRIIIDRGIPNSGRYVWTVGNYVGGQLTAGGIYKIKVCTMGTIGETVCDKSDNRFTVKASSAMINNQVASVLQSVQGVLNLLNQVIR